MRLKRALTAESPAESGRSADKLGLGGRNHLRSWVITNVWQSKGWAGRTEGAQAHHIAYVKEDVCGGCVLAEWWNMGSSLCGGRVKGRQNQQIWSSASENWYQ